MVQNLETCRVCRRSSPDRVTLSAPSCLPPRLWFSTLKFRIVLLTVMTGILSAAGTTAVVLKTTESSMERLVITEARAERERSARLLGSKH